MRKVYSKYASEQVWLVSSQVPLYNMYYFVSDSCINAIYKPSHELRSQVIKSMDEENMSMEKIADSYQHSTIKYFK